MKGFAYAAAISAIFAVSSVQGMQSFLKQLPNGDKFEKALGHKGDSGYTAFGTAFLNAGTTWNADFCKQTFPGAKITNGQAFGDPCCTWKAGSPAPQSVSAFTTDPGAGTTCASDNKASPAPAPSGGNSTPSNGGGSSSAGGNKATPAPAGGNNNNGGDKKKPSPAPGGSNKKPKACKKNKKKNLL